jgi:hypothetical protein
MPNALDATTPDEQRELEDRMHTLNDRALLRLVALEQSEYRPEAIEAARAEIARRKLPALLNAEQYWDRFPSERIGKSGFCQKCLDETTDVSQGTAVTFWGIGVRLLGYDDLCPACGSVRQSLWVCFFIPILRLGRYRILYRENSLFGRRYVGRELKKSAEGR